jgi:hypothetical protein
MFFVSGQFASGVKDYATAADLPLTGVQPGTLAFVEQNLQGNSALYLWKSTQNGGGWYKIATVNLAPVIVEGPEPSYAVPNDGEPLVLTLVAEDPEGLPISWNFQVADGDPSGIATVTQVQNVFTISADPAAISGQVPGSFSLTFTASDGVSLSAATSVFTLAFSVGPSNPLTVAVASTTDGFPIIRWLYKVADKMVLVNSSPANGDAALDLYDVSSTPPVFVSRLPQPNPALGTNVSFPSDQPIGVIGGRVAIADNGVGSAARVHIFNISIPEAPVYERGVSLSDAKAVLAVGGEFVVVRTSSVTAIDPITGAQVGNATYGNGAYDPGVSFAHLSDGHDGHIFVVPTRQPVSGNTIDYAQVFERLSSGSLVRRASTALNTSNANSVRGASVFDGRYFFARRLPAGAQALLVYDLVDPANPALVFTESSPPATAAVQQTRMLVVDGFIYTKLGASVLVHSVQDPTSPDFIGFVPETGSDVSSGLEAENGALFVGSGPVGARVLLELRN